MSQREENSRERDRGIESSSLLVGANYMSTPEDIKKKWAEEENEDEGWMLEKSLRRALNSALVMLSRAYRDSKNLPWIWRALKMGKTRVFPQGAQGDTSLANYPWTKVLCEGWTRNGHEG